MLTKDLHGGSAQPTVVRAIGLEVPAGLARRAIEAAPQVSLQIAAIVVAATSSSATATSMLIATLPAAATPVIVTAAKTATAAMIATVTTAMAGFAMLAQGLAQDIMIASAAGVAGMVMATVTAAAQTNERLPAMVILTPTRNQTVSSPRSAVSATAMVVALVIGIPMAASRPTTMARLTRAIIIVDVTQMPTAMATASTIAATATLIFRLMIVTT